MKYVVQFSTGAASAEAAWRIVQREGAAAVTLLSADTLVEDEDNWRFARAVVRLLGTRWIVLADGRTPMGVGRDKRVVPNDRMAVCSRILKRELLRDWLDEHCDPADTTIVLGFDWTEEHRIARAQPLWAPFRISCPLASPPFTQKEDTLDAWRGRGIEPPRLYRLGFSHANCGGGCVRGGQAQWALLRRVMPERYDQWADEEEAIRGLLGRDVSILADRSGGGKRRPLTLRKLAARIDAQQTLDLDDWGACSCMDEVEQP